jgi:hypothetical protein
MSGNSFFVGCFDIQDLREQVKQVDVNFDDAQVWR